MPVVNRSSCVLPEAGLAVRGFVPQVTKPADSAFRFAVFIALAWVCVEGVRPLPAAAQAPAPESGPVPGSFEVFAGGELETYLRTLQNRGRIEAYPWAIRSLSPGDVHRLAVPDSAHPWAGRYVFGAERGERLEYGLVRPTAAAQYNSAFPFGGNDGPVWVGRGLTLSASGGGWIRYGPLSLVVAPVAFRAGNRSFDLAPAGSGEMSRYRSPLTPNRIDLPQRFGAGPYARLDPGNSTLRVEGLGMTAGVSTAAQQWGPSQVHPLVLGPNAGGFPHVFLGTERPLDIWFARVHGKYVAGRLEESRFSPSTLGDGRRVMSGFAFVLTPRGLEGLEVGLTRFFHQPWPEDGLDRDHLFRPFETFWKQNIPGADQRPDSQLASVFARWNFPGVGFELFGEYVRVDHSFDSRIFILEPDDQAGHALGFRRVWEGSDGTLTVLRGETLTTGSSHRERFGARIAAAFTARPIYHHHQIRQGHTHRGQLLATPAGHFGTGSTLGVDRYRTDGRWTVEWERRVVRDRSLGAVPEDGGDVDVMYVLSGELVRFRGPVDVQMGAWGVYNMNRHFRESTFNLGLRVGASVVLR